MLSRTIDLAVSPAVPSKATVGITDMTDTSYWEWGDWATVPSNDGWPVTPDD